MSQLQAFLNVLQTSELNKIKKVRIIGKEKKVFDYIYAYRHKELPEVEKICNDLGITSTHFYKICSVLMDKFYDELIPERGYNLLYFLNRKDLYSHFTHEMLMQEKEMVKEGVSKAELEEFYLKGFTFLQRVFAKNLDEELILKYGEKYLSAKTNKQEHDEYYVRCSYLATKLFLLKATKKDIETSVEVLNELEKIEKVLEKTSNILAKFQMNRAFSVYFNHCSSHPQKVISYLNDNLRLIEASPELFTREEQVLIKCKIAEMYYMDSDFDKAFHEYFVNFQLYSDVLNNDFYHHAKFAQVALIVEKYDFAKELIENRFNVFIESKQAGIGTMGSLLLAKYYLLKGPNANALKYIQLAKKLIGKSFYIQYELEARILENIYFILRKDMKSAKSLLKKNIKFMNSKGFNLKNSEMIYVFVLLQEILKSDFKEKRFTNRLQNKYNLLHKSYAAVYGKLLEIVMETVNEEVAVG